MGASIEELLADVAGGNAEARLAGYQALLDKQNEGDNFLSKELNVGQFLRIACSDAESENTELVMKALKCLGYFSHHSHRVQSISDEWAGAILHKLVGIAVSAKEKVPCNYAMWCIAVQQFNANVVASYAESLVGAIVHAINNPMGSLCVTYEAIQALTTIRRVVPSKARELSHIWAPPLYKSLVADRRERELARNALTDLSECIYPPSPALSEVVSSDINQSLLTKMKIMATKGQAVTAINAWKHYVRLLGDQLARDTSLVNAMLKIPEITLMSKDLNVRIASQAAWESFIDALVPPQSSLSGIRLKLLLMPTFSALEFENDTAAKIQLLRTWWHLLTRLSSWLDDPLVFEAAVISVLEVIIRAGPVKDPYIWQNAMALMEQYVGAKCLLLPDFSKLDFNEEYQALLPPVELVTGDDIVNCRVWDFRQLESILRAVEILWACGTSHFQADSQSTPGKASMGAAIRIWTLVVKAVNDYQQGTVTPSSHQISTVHLLLQFISTACKPDVNRSRGSEWTIWCWRMISILVDELGPLVLASSFYIIRAPWQDSSQPTSLGVFPATLLTFVWLKLSCYEEFDSQRLQRLVRASFAGLDISGSLQGILSAFDALMCYEHVLSLSWRVVADELKNQLETTNDVPWSGIFGFSGVFGLLLFPLKFYREGAATGSGNVDFKLISSSWNRLHDTAIRICMLKGGPCNSFLGGLYHRVWKAVEDVKTVDQQLVELVGPGVVFALDHVQVANLAEYMLNRKRKGIHHRVDDASNTRDLLSVAARLLCVPAQVSLLPERVFVALAGFVKRVSTQQDALMLLNVLDEALVFWFKLGLQISVSLTEKLQDLWSSLLSCLQTCQPPVLFDSKLLKLQSTSLKLAFRHPYSPIPNTTLSFWEATYAKRAATLIYPASLLRVVQELKSSARVTVPNPASARTFSEPDDSEIQKISFWLPATPPADQQRQGTAGLPRSVSKKRVKLTTRKNAEEEAGDEFVVVSSKEVKERPLTEHQKEVRELQRREGPGVKTYTTADFSQGDALDDSDEQAQTLPATELINQAFAADFSAPRSLEVVMDDAAAAQGSDLLVEEIAPFKLSKGKRTYPMTGDQVQAYVSQAPSPARKEAGETDIIDCKAALSRLEGLASWSGWHRLGVDELLKATRLVKVIQDKLAAEQAGH